MTNLSSECYAAFGSGGGPEVIAFLEWLVSHRGPGAPVDVLDVGCGPGRMFSAFRALGWDVTAMEPDQEFHEAATAAATAAGYSPPLRGGFLEIDAREAFGLVTAINDPFAHMLTGGQKAEALSRAYSALRPGGVVVIDLPNFLWILKNYRAPGPMRAPVSGGEVHLLREHVIDFHAAAFTTIEHYSLVRDGKEHRCSRTHAYAMTTWPELQYLFEQTGFVHLETYGSWDARASQRLDGPRMIISAVRP